LVTHHFDHKLDCITYVGLKEKAWARHLKGEEVPTHIKLANLEDILKMRQTLTMNGGVEGMNMNGWEEVPNMNGEVEETTMNGGMEEMNMNGGLEGGQMGGEFFVFVADYLVGTVIGKKEWDRYKFRQWVTKHFTETDEASLYGVVL
jgi:hypothetical protein